jgi:hypothetical protein
MPILTISHDAGFFSCATVRLITIMDFFHHNGCLPDSVDSSALWSQYKSNEGDVTNLFFREEMKSVPITSASAVLGYRNFSPHSGAKRRWLVGRRRKRRGPDVQYVDYKTLEFDQFNPFVKRYFTPSAHVLARAEMFEGEYRFKESSFCCVLYRGNDKATETTIAPYDAFIDMAGSVRARHPEIKFQVRTDETEFLEAFLEVYPDETVSIEEVPHMRRHNSAVADHLEKSERAEFGVNFLASILCGSRCDHLITHTGNCGLWAVLFRGNASNVYQILDNEWL